MESKTLHQAAAALDVHHNTTLRWRHRLLKGVKDDGVPKLENIAEADEIYFFDPSKGRHQFHRVPCRRGGKAVKPGLSNEQMCVLATWDRTGQTLD